MAIVMAAVEATSRPQITAPFGTGHRGVPHGAFYHGWRLLLLTQQASVTRDAAQLMQLHDEADRLLTALERARRASTDLLYRAGVAL